MAPIHLMMTGLLSGVPPLRRDDAGRTWLRAAPGKPWLRLDGFTTSAELIQEYRRLIASR